MTASITRGSSCPNGWLPMSVACGGKAPADTRPYCARIWSVTTVTARQVRASGRRKIP
ncbi:hypothetical protein BC477_08050 [Clavibacter michiganensis subsp. michiganensis]|uniref:Uncharacterized protein n=1 Tax=Clavibacter michiganensis subsp. michiganensis TaxID=33013 RepID=A0A251XN89_CLAMM|nr:hypothetical protein BC477_08050 [Clavibacter michiganensis subsp. michiganensis]OUE04673.1 hypothetical protein CMMCAS07_06980 [Clavibacter michiganensis subsp. michiganensis]